jgi:hypothetical protein
MTATRPRLLDCPTSVVHAAESLLGDPIIGEQPAPAGFTRTIASLVATERTTVFVKAAPAPDSQAIRNAITIAPYTPQVAPSLLGWADLGAWALACWEPVDGATIAQWRHNHVAPLQELLATMSALLDPTPLAGLTPWAEQMQRQVGTWGRLDHDAPGPNTAHLDPTRLPTPISLSTLAALEADFAEVASSGAALLHGDLRTDNFVALPSGRLYLIDWTNLISGPGWVDLAILLPDLARSGLDPQAIWAASPWAQTPDHYLDVVLAALAGYWFNASRRQPVPHAGGLRTLQRVQADSALSLLERRLSAY